MVKNLKKSTHDAHGILSTYQPWQINQFHMEFRCCLGLTVIIIKLITIVTGANLNQHSHHWGASHCTLRRNHHRSKLPVSGVPRVPRLPWTRRLSALRHWSHQTTMPGTPRNQFQGLTWLTQVNYCQLLRDVWGVFFWIMWIMRFNEDGLMLKQNVPYYLSHGKNRTRYNICMWF